MSLLKTAIACAAGSALFMGAASAQDTYVSVSGSGSFQYDSDNMGAFSSAFTTGEGTTIPGGVVLPEGTNVGWLTEFKTGFGVSAAVGKRYSWFRGELEFTYQANDVDTHSGVYAADIPLDGEDAGVLITGSPNLGVSVGDLVADGQGRLENMFLMLNFYADLDTGSRVKPYIGGGVGVGFVDVNYMPSATPIIDDSASAFAYQGMAGVSVEITPATEMFLGYRYRGTSDVSVEASLFAADFEIENTASIAEAGIRFSF